MKSISSGEIPIFPHEDALIPLSLRNSDNKFTSVVFPFVPVTPIIKPLKFFENKSISVYKLIFASKILKRLWLGFTPGETTILSIWFLYESSNILL